MSIEERKGNSMTHVYQWFGIVVPVGTIAVPLAFIRWAFR